MSKVKRRGFPWKSQCIWLVVSRLMLSGGGALVDGVVAY